MQLYLQVHNHIKELTFWSDIICLIYFGFVECLYIYTDFLKNNLNSWQSNRKLKLSVRSWIDAQSSCLGFSSFTVPLIYSVKRPINYCCIICTTVCIIFKKRLFIEALCRPLFRKHAHCKPLFPCQNNA